MYLTLTGSGLKAPYVWHVADCMYDEVDVGAIPSPNRFVPTPGGVSSIAHRLDLRERNDDITG